MKTKEEDLKYMDKYNLCDDWLPAPNKDNWLTFITLGGYWEEPFPEDKVICTYVDLDSTKIFKLMVCGSAGHSLEKSFYDRESLVVEIEEITGTISKDILLSRGYIPEE